MSFKGKTVPDIRFEYKYDIQSFFNYFNMLNASEIARRSGMSPSLMRQYTCGTKKAGEKVYRKLSESINSITTEISSAMIGTK